MVAAKSYRADPLAPHIGLQVKLLLLLRGNNLLKGKLPNDRLMAFLLVSAAFLPKSKSGPMLA